MTRGRARNTRAASWRFSRRHHRRSDLSSAHVKYQLATAVSARMCRSAVKPPGPPAAPAAPVCCRDERERPPPPLPVSPAASPQSSPPPPDIPALPPP